MSQQRDVFRIPFPVTERPRLIVGAREFDIVDLSESGARILLDNRQPPATGQFLALIQLSDGTHVRALASVQRQEDDQLVVCFAEQLPYQIIAAEQRRLLRLYSRDVFARHEE